MNQCRGHNLRACSLFPGLEYSDDRRTTKLYLSYNIQDEEKSCPLILEAANVSISEKA